jgi:hypothetical protein
MFSKENELWSIPSWASGFLCRCASRASCPNKRIYEFISQSSVREGPLKQEDIVTHNSLVKFNPLKPSGRCMHHQPEQSQILHSAHTVYLCVLCGSQNKQRFFHKCEFTYPCPCSHTQQATLHTLCWRQVSAPKISHYQSTKKNHKMETSIYYRTETSPFTSIDKSHMYVKQLRFLRSRK